MPYVLLCLLCLEKCLYKSETKRQAESVRQSYRVLGDCARERKQGAAPWNWTANHFKVQGSSQNDVSKIVTNMIASHQPFVHLGTRPSQYLPDLKADAPVEIDGKAFDDVSAYKARVGVIPADKDDNKTKDDAAKASCHGFQF